eukprot:TRINITY_DN5279_c2_g1_i1.p1 TRINITY_DN5279_c2_g1~~TRINITY_DN5279_c2_g1_i1.p1  ORF type:complete len:514 (+),score=143.63 TRINITY_DN5279_c2_g1_i1:56-1543(+)
MRGVAGVLVSAASAAAVPVTLYQGQNQVFGVAESQGDTATTKYLGSFDTAGDCQSACAQYKDRCWSYTWHHTDFGGEFARQCFGLTAPRFSPTPDDKTTTGVMLWPCRDDGDCSLNGKCSGGACACHAPWRGHRCEELGLQPATRSPLSGYRGTDGGHNTSSWGGAVLRGDDGKYHMWAAEMTEHCGIGAWGQNSRIIHAVSSTPGGSYNRTQVVWDVFSHEPEVVKGPNGEYVMYFTATFPGRKHGDCKCCQSGSKCDGSTGPTDCGGFQKGEPSLRHPDDSSPSWVSYAQSPDGPWSTPQQIFKGYEGSDTNFAPVILKNGSLVAIWRSWGPGRGGSRPYLATASDWKDPSTYVQHKTELFPDLGNAGTEDPFVYIDPRGNYHAVFHHMYGYHTSTQWWLDAVGGHAFSADGITWTYSGVAWGNATARQQGNVVTFKDGSTFRYTRRERPHLIFDASGEISALSTSAQYGTGTNPGIPGDNGDACYTLVQPTA